MRFDDGCIRCKYESQCSVARRYMNNCYWSAKTNGHRPLAEKIRVLPKEKVPDDKGHELPQDKVHELPEDKEKNVLGRLSRQEHHCTASEILVLKGKRCSKVDSTFKSSVNQKKFIKSTSNLPRPGDHQSISNHSEPGNHRRKPSVIHLRNLTILKPLHLLCFASFLWASSSAATELSEDDLQYLSQERAKAAKTWAPVIFLHPEERFYPAAVHTFLKNVIPREVPPHQRPPEPPVIISMSRSLDTLALPEGPAGDNTYLIAPIDSECKNCPLPKFLFGNKPSSKYSPPVYAIISSCLPLKKNSKLFRRSRTLQGGFRTKPSRRFLFRRRSGRFRNRARRSSSEYDYFHERPYDGSKLREGRDVEAQYQMEENNSTSDPTSESLNYLFNLNDEIKIAEDSTKGQLVLANSTLQSLDETRVITDNPQSAESLQEEVTEIPSPPELFDYVIVQEAEESREQTVRLEATANQQISEIPNSNETLYADGSNYTFYTQENTRVTKNPEITSQHNTQNHHHHYQADSANHLKQPTNNNTEDKQRDLRGHRYTITYWMFYPFSQGKAVCTSHLWPLGRVFKLRLRNKCFGESITLNSHVGDWEHVSIYFEDNLPQLMYVSMHTYGAFYQYDPRDNIFIYKGKDTRLGIPLSPKYPTIIKIDGTHPLLYAAQGSHGLWGAPGVHKYESLIPLEDKAAPGVPWESWKNIDVIDYRKPDFDRADRQWLQFHGRWGNPASGCHRALFGTCDLASGPTGIPLKRQNFPCHIPSHPTFFPKD